jgi:hypothetical protein
MPGSRVHGGAPRAEIKKIDGMPLVRVTFDIDGVPARLEAVQHVDSFAAWSDRGIYILGISTSLKHAPAIDAFVDDAMTTVHLLHRAPTGMTSYELGGYVARIFYWGAVGLVGAVALIWHLRRKKKKRRKRRKKPRAATPPTSGPSGI